MKLVLGPPSMSIDFEFTLFKTHGKFTIVDGKLSCPIRNFGLYFSGGLDSAALLCLMIEERKSLKLDTPLTAFTVYKNEFSTLHARKALDAIEKHYDIHVDHVTDIPNDPDANIKGNLGSNAMKFVSEYKPHMLLYMGINRMAPDDVRPFKEKLNIDYGFSTVSKHYRAPFLFLHKPHIVDIFYKLNCEDIIPYTQSCSVLKQGKCGQCYACKEREWGFTLLGKVDPAH